LGYSSGPFQGDEKRGRGSLWGRPEGSRFSGEGAIVQGNGGGVGPGGGKGT